MPGLAPLFAGDNFFCARRMVACRAILFGSCVASRLGSGLRPVYVIRSNDRDLAQVRAAFRLQQVAGGGNLAVYEVLGPATASR